MRNLMGCFVLFVVLISIGCYNTPPTPAPPNKQVSKGHRWGDPVDWVNDPPAVAPVKFENLSFEDPKIKRGCFAGRMLLKNYAMIGFITVGTGKG